MDDWDDEEVDLAFEWTGISILHSYAWKAAQGYFSPWITRVFGMQLIDILKQGELTEVSSRPYIDVFIDVADSGSYPLWD